MFLQWHDIAQHLVTNRNSAKNTFRVYDDFELSYEFKISCYSVKGDIHALIVFSFFGVQTLDSSFLHFLPGCYWKDKAALKACKITAESKPGERGHYSDNRQSGSQRVLSS